MSTADRIEKKVHLRARKAEAFRMNDQGWTVQAENIARHVTSA